MQFSNNAYLLIGGNVGNRFSYLQRATEFLDTQCGKIKKKSAVYETAPWGNTQQAAFFNQAIHLSTSFTADVLMLRLLDIEEQLGRRRLEKYGPRTIDMDILLFNEEIFQSPSLTIPHKELQNRRFALQPLADIAGEKLHPVLHKPIMQLLIECADPLEVRKLGEADDPRKVNS